MNVGPERGDWLPVGSPDERQGTYYRTDVYVWYCGDEECDCHQPVAERVYWHALVRGAQWRVRVWEGAYHSQPTAAEMREMNEDIHYALRAVQASGDRIGDVGMYDPDRIDARLPPDPPARG
jgi:hypothetical protein